MGVSDRQDVSIGVTYAVRHLKRVFKLLQLIYKNEASFPEAAGDEIEKRRQSVEDKLRSNKMYKEIGADTQISGIVLGYIYRTDNMMDKLVTWDKRPGHGDWQPTVSLLGKFLDTMETDLHRVINATDTSQQLVKAGFTGWQWDAAREDHYYWCSVDRTYKYQSGLWLRLDGSHTSFEQEMELAKANSIPFDYTLESSMGQLAIQ